MKSNQKSEIAAFLEEFQKRLSTVNKAVQKLADIQSDVAEFEATIAKLGQPHYKNKEKHLELNTTKTQLEACQTAYADQKNKIGETLAPLADMLTKAGGYACDILQEVVNNRLETVTSCLLQFSLNRASAVNAALQTDACRAAGRSATIYNQISMHVRTYSGSRFGAPETLAEYAEEEFTTVIAAAEKIEAVLAESVSKAPDLMQFIPFVPASATATDDNAGDDEAAASAAPRKQNEEPNAV